MPVTELMKRGWNPQISGRTLDGSRNEPADIFRKEGDPRPELLRNDQLEATPDYELERVFGARGPGRRRHETAPRIVVGGWFLGRALALGNVPD